MTDYPTLLLVHGSWHGPWCWKKLMPELGRLGFKSATVALPSCGSDPTLLRTVADDAAAVEAAVAQIAGDVVVLGHSYAGVALTEAQFDTQVRHLIYLGAFMPDAGRSLMDLYPPEGAIFWGIDADGSTWVDPAIAIDTFFHDCDPQTAAWAASLLRRHNGVNNMTPVTRASWREMTSTYIVLTEDRCVAPSTQRQLAKQAVDEREMPTSHSPFLSRPAELAAMVRDIVASHIGLGLD